MKNALILGCVFFANFSEFLFCGEAENFNRVNFSPSPPLKKDLENRGSLSSRSQSPLLDNDPDFASLFSRKPGDQNHKKKNNSCERCCVIS